MDLLPADDNTIDCGGIFSHTSYRAADPYPRSLEALDSAETDQLLPMYIRYAYISLTFLTFKAENNRLLCHSEFCTEHLKYLGSLAA